MGSDFANEKEREFNPTNPTPRHHRYPNLYPEPLSYDPTQQHFVLGSHRHRTLLSISDASIFSTLISDPSLPPNSTIHGALIDRLSRRLLAVGHSLFHPSTPSPPTTSVPSSTPASS